MSEFELRRLIREELASSAVADPHVIAEHVAKQVPEESLRDALAEALGPMVLIVNGAGRRALMAPAPTKAGATESPRWNAVAAMHQRIQVGDGWKFLADCTRTDLETAASLRREHAAHNIAWANRFDALADLLRRKRAKTVADLPPGAVEEVLAA